MSFQRENLRSLDVYRLHDPNLLRQGKYSVVASLRTQENGLVLHSIGCRYIQGPLAEQNTELRTWSKFGIQKQDILAFVEAAGRADVPLFYTCPGCHYHLNS
jgi:hypothetical protein